MKRRANALERGERRAFSDVWVQGDAQEAWFVRNANRSIFRDPDMRGSVLFGTGKAVPKGGSFELWHGVLTRPGPGGG